MQQRNTIIRNPQPPASVHAAADGTRKYTFALPGGLAIETVYIPDGNRHTLCVSTQAGCRMGCHFCATGQMRLQAQLSIEQILNQIASVPEAPLLTHLVFMGMGEPFDNPTALFPALEALTYPKGFAFAPRRISVSTAGVLPGIENYLRHYKSPLSISLHSPFHDERAALMPIEHQWPIARICASIRAIPRSSQRRIFCEYLVIRDLNHTPRHALAIAELFQGIPVRINLMRPHPIPGATFPPAPDEAMLSFRDALNKHGLIATIRRSRGIEIEAACGMLAIKSGSREH